MEFLTDIVPAHRHMKGLHWKSVSPVEVSVYPKTRRGEPDVIIMANVLVSKNVLLIVRDDSLKVDKEKELKESKKFIITSSLLRKVHKRSVSADSSLQSVNESTNNLNRTMTNHGLTRVYTTNGHNNSLSRVMTNSSIVKNGLNRLTHFRRHSEGSAITNSNTTITTIASSYQPLVPTHPIESILRQPKLRKFPYSINGKLLSSLRIPMDAINQVISVSPNAIEIKVFLPKGKIDSSHFFAAHLMHNATVVLTFKHPFLYGESDILKTILENTIEKKQS